MLLIVISPGHSPDRNRNPPFKCSRPRISGIVVGIQKVSEDDDWTRHFRIGAMVGLNISANFSMKGTFTYRQ